MAMNRAPKDIGSKSRSVTGIRKAYSNGNLLATKTYTGVVERDNRPTYRYGAKEYKDGKLVWITPTDYSHESWEAPDTYYAMDTYKQGNSQLLYVDEGLNAGRLVGLTNPVYPGVPTDARNESVTKALNKIADQKINLGENLATFRQTLGMFTGRAWKLSNMLHAGFREKSFRPYFRRTARSIRRKGGNSVNDAAGFYLEYVYGLKPLMDDVYTGLELLKDAGVVPMYLSSRGSASRTQELQAQTHDPQVIERIGGGAQVTVKTKLYAEIDPNTSALRTLNQFGLLNPLGLAWDLVPFSFVVDWFVPVGPLLYALTAPAGLLFRGGSTSARTSQTNIFEMGASYTGSPSTLRQVKAIVPVVYEGFTRQAHKVWPIPGYWWTNDPFTGDHDLKALALSIQALNGKSRDWSRS